MEAHPQLSRLYYFLDPMCSWCWAFRPALQKVEAQLPENVELIRMLGGLAADTDDPMPEAMCKKLQEIWRTIQLKVPGTEFNFRYWKSLHRDARPIVLVAR